jgi:hypothetical protein
MFSLLMVALLHPSEAGKMERTTFDIAFAIFDANGNGLMEVDEFKAMFRALYQTRVSALKLVYTSKAGHAMLQEFAESELSTENMEFVDAVDAWAAMDDAQRGTLAAGGLLDQFVGDAAKTPVNLPAKATAKLQADYKAAVDGGVETLGNGFFEESKKEILKVIEKDTFARFNKDRERMEALMNRGPGSTIADLVSRGSWDAPKKPRRSGMACVSNLGSFANWTGHVLAASNTFGFGKLAWDPTRTAESVNAEWAAATFPGGDGDVRAVVEDILARGRDLYEGYTSPLGVGFIVFGGSPSSVTNASGGCAPVTGGPGTGPKGATCPVSPGLRDLRGGLDHYWVDPCSSYGSSNYSDYGLGCDRTSSGTGYAEFYAPEVRAMFEDVDACPVKNLLWFHNVPWTRPMPTPANYTPATADATVPLYDYIRFQHYDAVAQVAELAKRWGALEGRVDDARFSGVKARFAQQVHDATAMCDTIMGQFDAWYHSG